MINVHWNFLYLYFLDAKFRLHLSNMKNDNSLTPFSITLILKGSIYGEVFMLIRDYVTSKQRLLGLRHRKNSKWNFLLTRAGYNKVPPVNQYVFSLKGYKLFPVVILLSHSAFFTAMVAIKPKSFKQGN